VLKQRLGERRVGHAGTLDPLARGVLVVGIGRSATRMLSTYVAKEKEYIAVIKLGMTSTTDDEEGDKQQMTNYQIPDVKRIKNVLREFIGEIMQVPPRYSAVKIKGKEAYKRARKGEIVHLTPRRVFVKDIEIRKYHWPFLTLRVVTGPGVYIRALARDLGKILGCGAYLSDLERVRVGDFDTKISLSPEDLIIRFRSLSSSPTSQS
jgi:tRNA pseudouridine55 synthase